MGSVPSTFATGYEVHAGLGYTTAFDAAIAPSLHATPTRNCKTLLVHR